MEIKKILIIEDNDLLAKQLIKILESLKYKNSFYINSLNAIYESEDIDLVFCNVSFLCSYMSERLSELQKIRRVPLIFIFNDFKKRYIKTIAHIEFLGFLIQPFRVDEIEALIQLSYYKYPKKNNTILNISNYKYIKESKKLFLEDKEQILTKKETILISLLFENINSIIPYNVLDDLVWKGSSVSVNTRRTFIYRVKKRFPNLHLKIEKNVGIGIFQNKYIIT